MLTLMIVSLFGQSVKAMVFQTQTAFQWFPVAQCKLILSNARLIDRTERQKGGGELRRKKSRGRDSFLGKAKLKQNTKD